MFWGVKERTIERETGEGFEIIGRLSLSSFCWGRDAGMRLAGQEDLL